MSRTHAIKLDVLSRRDSGPERSILPDGLLSIDFAGVSDEQIVRFQARQSDGVQVITKTGIETARYLLVYAKYTADDDTATPDPIRNGDMAPFRITVNGATPETISQIPVLWPGEGLDTIQVRTDYETHPVEFVAIIG